ncbi:uncharacterized protein N7473_010842 [Penicillium subrubescens]|uniref:uncharacterized protein n=1 Tax=Penicillium subrubescens TaxID=1316194 RepID=UPI002545320D|nr:uncharacterized protein N7473_010842 [Penicillium subrubescens]KAJ5883956.1 hypothetical protein N7473_010842 [Penicillium subrubescens]
MPRPPITWGVSSRHPPLATHCASVRLFSPSEPGSTGNSCCAKYSWLQLKKGVPLDEVLRKLLTGPVLVWNRGWGWFD